MTDPSAPETATNAPCNNDVLPSKSAFLGHLSAPRLGLFAALLGMILTLPALWSGFAQDDYFFLMVFKGSPGLDMLDQTPLETYSFSKGDAAIQVALTERGLLPWWAVEGWKVNFWRPLASFSNWVDFKLFGEMPWPMHLHSIVLYGMLVFVAALLYRRFLPSAWAAGLAALLFAMDSGHAIPVAWLSMRNALLTAFFGLLVLYAHDRWRHASVSTGRLNAWFPHGFLALIWLALGLLGGESAVAVGGFLFAYALFIDPATTMPSAPTGLKRYAPGIGAILPYLGVVIIWRAVYSGLGYGTEGSGLYIDPVANPVEFLQQLPAHMAVLLLGLFAMPDAGLWGLMPAPLNHFHLALAAVFVLVAAWIIYPTLRHRAEARFLLLGVVLSIVPACATMPMDRLMTFSSFGALGLVALVLTDLREKILYRGSRPKILLRGVAVILILSHLIVAPLGLAIGTQHLTMMNRILTDSNPSIPRDLPAATRVVALNIPIDLLGASLPIHRSAEGLPVLDHWWWLYAGVQEITVERSDQQTLILRPEQGYNLPLWSEIFRLPTTDPVKAGDHVALSGASITVNTVSDDGRPLEVQFVFDVPLEDPSLHFVSWQRGTYIPFEIPATGSTTTIPAIHLVELIPVALGLNQ